MAARVLLKVVPGSSRDRVAGLLGDSLKVCVRAPPEDGRANRAVEAFMAKALAVNPRSVRIAAGHGTPRKTLEVDGLNLAEVLARLGVGIPLA